MRTKPLVTSIRFPEKRGGDVPQIKGCPKRAKLARLEHIALRPSQNTKTTATDLRMQRERLLSAKG